MLTYIPFQRRFLQGCKKISALVVSGLVGIFAEGSESLTKHPDSYYQTEKWPRKLFQVTIEGALKDVFDAGFFPYHWPNMPSDTLEFKHVNISLRTPDEKVLPEFPTEYSKIEINPSGILRMTLIGQSLTISEAEEEMGKWILYINETRENLSRFLQGVEDDPVTFDDKNFGAPLKGFGGGWVDANGIGYGVRFKKSYNSVVPIRIYLSINWIRLRSQEEKRTFYTGAVSSPVGYEDYVIGPGENVGPDSWVDMAQAKNIPLPEGSSVTGIFSGQISESGRHLREALPQKKDQNNPIDRFKRFLDEDRYFVIIVIIFFMIVVSLFVSCRYLKKNKG